MRRLACLVVFVALAAPAPAAAHAKLVRTEPANGAVLSTAPARVLVLFDDVVTVGPGNEVVRNGGGSVLAAKARSQGKTLVLPLRPNLRDGAYSARWSVISDDGHEEQGVLAFAVGTSQPPPVSTLRAGGELGFRNVFARWLFFAGLLVAGGLALFDVAVWRPVVRAALPTGWAAIALAATFVAASSLVHLSHAGASTRFGLVVGSSAAVAAAGATAAAIAVVDRTAAPFALVLALVLLPAPTLAGHSVDAGRSWVDGPIDFLHVLAVAFWLGGLVALTLVVPRSGAPPELATAAARRFSRLALVAVLAIAATGVGRALAELAAVSQLWTTGYGRAILVKTALFAILVGLGWVSRSRLAAGYARLRASVGAELAVVLGLVVAVAFLTALPPGRRVRAEAAPVATARPRLPARDALVLGQRDGTFAASIAVRASGAVTAQFIGPETYAVDVGPVEIDGRPARSCGTACYAGRVGRGRVVTVAHGGRTLRFQLGRGRPATALVARATRTYRNMRSVVFDETIASIGGVVAARWTQVAPSDFSYRIASGARAIVLGTRRWDRVPGDRWRSSTTPATPMPAPVWGGSFTNARLLRADANAYVVSFLVPNETFPAWFTVAFERRTLHPLRLQMTAAAHFMHVRYLAWNEPIRLRPPAG